MALTRIHVNVSINVLTVTEVQGERLTLQRGEDVNVDDVFTSGCVVLVLANADVSPARVQRHLRHIGTIEVARVNPHRGSVEIGSVIRPEKCIRLSRSRSVPKASLKLRKLLV